MTAQPQVWGRPLQGTDDTALLTSVRTGDVEAYAELWRRHLPAAYSVAHRYRGRAPAEDVVGEASLRLYALIKAGKGPDSNFRAYFLSTVRTVATDYVRTDLRVLPTETEALDALAGTSPAFDPGASVDQEMVRAAFAGLPERDQKILWFTAVEGDTPAKIAGDLGMTANGVSVTAMRARDSLRAKYLDAHGLRAISRAEDDECRWVLSHMGRYVRGKLPVRQRAHVEEHLRQCRHAQSLAYEMADVNRTLPSLIVPIIFLAAVAGKAGWISLAALLGTEAARAGTTAASGAATAPSAAAAAAAPGVTTAAGGSSATGAAAAGGATATGSTTAAGGAAAAGGSSAAGGAAAGGSSAAGGFIATGGATTATGAAASAGAATTAGAITAAGAAAATGGATAAAGAGLLGAAATVGGSAATVLISPAILWAGGSAVVAAAAAAAVFVLPSIGGSNAISPITPITPSLSSSAPLLSAPPVPGPSDTLSSVPVVPPLVEPTPEETGTPVSDPSPTSPLPQSSSSDSSSSSSDSSSSSSDSSSTSTTSSSSSSSSTTPPIVISPSARILLLGYRTARFEVFRGTSTVNPTVTLRSWVGPLLVRGTGWDCIPAQFRTIGFGRSVICKTASNIMATQRVRSPITFIVVARPPRVPGRIQVDMTGDPQSGTGHLYLISDREGITQGRLP